jgi:hypothetical protein
MSKKLKTPDKKHKTPFAKFVESDRFVPDYATSDNFTVEGDDVAPDYTGAAAVHHAYHHEALAVAGVKPHKDDALVELVANVSSDGPSGRVGLVTAHKVLAALAAHKEK